MDKRRVLGLRLKEIRKRKGSGTENQNLVNILLCLFITL